MLYQAQAIAQDVAQQPESGGDIVVTAQRTQSLASRTPIALSAITGEALRTAGVTNPLNLGTQIPNLSIVAGNGLTITIRGVTSVDKTSKGDPSAAFLLDGIYIARPQVQEVSFFDIARVEVLRGPQGTLYGRNTTAGVVNVISNRPSDHFEAAGNFTYGNFKTVQGDAMLNLPVNEKIALRASVSYDKRDSYLRQLPGDPYSFDPYKKNINGRLQALFDVNDDINILIKGDYSSIKGSPPVAVIGGSFFNRTNPRNPIRVVNDADTLRTIGYRLVGDSRQDNSTWGISGELNWNFGPLTATYLGSYREFKRDENFSFLLAGPVPNNISGKAKQNSQELRFATNGDGPLKLQFGGYYFRENSNGLQMLFNALPGIPYYGFPEAQTINKTYAFFGQGTYSILPELRLTLGARYSKDDKSRDSATVMQQTATFNPATDRRLINYAKYSSSKVTYRAGLEYDLASRTLLYGTFSTGYKSGGFNDGCLAGSIINGVACNQPRTPDALFYKPETLNSYEVGMKARLFDNAVRFEMSAFHYDYSNLQLSQLTIVNGGPTSVTTNAAKAKVSGIEVEATLVPHRNNRVDLSFTYLDAHYGEYRPLAASEPSLNYSGRALDRSPRIVVTAGYAYTYPFASGATLEAGVRTRLSEKYVLTTFSVPTQYVQPSYTRTDATLTYNAPGRRWYLQGFGNNLENKVVLTGIASGVNMFVSDPRTYGVRAGFRF